MTGEVGIYSYRFTGHTAVESIYRFPFFTARTTVLQKTLSKRTLSVKNSLSPSVQESSWMQTVKKEIMARRTMAYTTLPYDRRPVARR